MNCLGTANPALTLIRNKQVPPDSILRFLPLHLLLVFLIGCSTPILDPDVHPSNKGTYIYGRFQKVQKGLGGSIKVVVRSKDETKKKYVVQMKSSDRDAVQAFEVPPGRYFIEEFSAHAGPFGFQLPVNPAYFSTTFAVEEGKAYYLGNFKGTVTYLPLLVVDVGKAIVEPATYEFENTTKLFREKHRYFNEFPCEPAFQPPDGEVR